MTRICKTTSEETFTIVNFHLISIQAIQSMTTSCDHTAEYLSFILSMLCFSCIGIFSCSSLQTYLQFLYWLNCSAIQFWIGLLYFCFCTQLVLSQLNDTSFTLRLFVGDEKLTEDLQDYERIGFFSNYDFSNVPLKIIGELEADYG